MAVLPFHSPTLSRGHYGGLSPGTLLLGFTPLSPQFIRGGQLEVPLSTALTCPFPT